MKTLKKHKSSIIAGLVLVLCLAAYFYRENLKTFFSKNVVLPSNSTAVVNTSTASVSSPTVSDTATNDTILKRGSKGAKVKELQELINKRMRATNMGFPELAEDGIFGAKTESRLQLLTGKKSISINEFLKYKA